MTGRCGACHWWKTPVDIPSPWGKLPEGTWGECVIARSRGNEPVNPMTRAFAMDHEDYEAHLLTEDDFGCVQFTEPDET